VETGARKGRVVDLRYHDDDLRALIVEEPEADDEERRWAIKFHVRDGGQDLPAVWARAGPLVCNADGTKVVGVDPLAPQTVNVWEADTGRLLHSLPVAEKAISVLAFRPDGKVLAAAFGRRVRVLTIATGIEATAIATGGEVAALVFSPDGARIATATSEGGVALWDAVTGKAIHRLERHPAGVSCLAFSRDGRRLASGDKDGEVVLWNAATGELLAAYRDHDKPVQSVAFNADGTRLASGCHDGNVCVREVADGR
jgi:WD40 repeat protein